MLKNASFRVPKTLWQQAKKRAIDEDRSLNGVVVRALESYAGARKDAATIVNADADEFVKRRGPKAPARHFTRDELHEDAA